MKIWKSYSSNHSSPYTVVGKFSELNTKRFQEIAEKVKQTVTVLDSEPGVEKEGNLIIVSGESWGDDVQFAVIELFEKLGAKRIW